MSQKGRYFLEAPESQRQDYQSFLQDSISFCNMGIEDTFVDSLDPEKLMQCPYDKNHQIRACRFPYHLVKCRKNHPDLVKKLVTCPFNARHQVPRAEISQHISSCDDKRCIEQDIASQLGSPRREINVVSSWQSPPCEEDWDKDLGNQTCPTFIWGQTHTELNSSRSNTSMGLKNHLGSGLRAPRSLPHTLPWKNCDRMLLPSPRIMSRYKDILGTILTNFPTLTELSQCGICYILQLGDCHGGLLKMLEIEDCGRLPLLEDIKCSLSALRKVEPGKKFRLN